MLQILTIVNLLLPHPVFYNLTEVMVVEHCECSTCH